MRNRWTIVFALVLGCGHDAEAVGDAPSRPAPSYRTAFDDCVEHAAIEARRLASAIQHRDSTRQPFDHDRLQGFLDWRRNLQPSGRDPEGATVVTGVIRETRTNGFLLGSGEWIYWERPISDAVRSARLVVPTLHAGVAVECSRDFSGVDVTGRFHPRYVAYEVFTEDEIEAAMAGSVEHRAERRLRGGEQGR